MGYGDELIASGQARGARERGVRVAFGDGEKIRWHPFAHQILAGNPNVAPPGSEGDADLEWIANYAGRRPYNEDVRGEHRWRWIPGQIRARGEVFLTEQELEFAERHGSGFVLMEPNVPQFKKVALNKQWPTNRYAQLSQRLQNDGHEIVQIRCHPPYGPGFLIPKVRQIGSPSFRHALAVMARAKLFVGSEGGMHHGAAAVGTPAAVIFGGFISPDVTGYPDHENLYAGGEACGSQWRCDHCIHAMRRISVDAVHEACEKLLARGVKR